MRRAREPMWGTILILLVGSCVLANISVALEHAKSPWFIALVWFGNSSVFLNAAFSIYRDRVA